MLLLKTNTLDPSQKDQVEELETLVFSHENLENHVFLSPELNVYKDFPSFFLCYEEEKLVSFLGAFFPTDEEVEFNGFTHPAYRRQGYFSVLIKYALETYLKLPFQRALFQREMRSQTGYAFLNKRYPEIERTEYIMQLSKAEYKSREHIDGTLELVGSTHLDRAAQLMSNAFDESLERSLDGLNYLLSQSDRKTFLYSLEGEAIGTLNAHKVEGTWMLHGVGILKEHRNQGKGKDMLSLALSTLFCDAPIVSLEVDSYNIPALSLYKKLGFVPTSQVDYHRLSL